MSEVIFHILLSTVTIQMRGVWEHKHHPRSCVDEDGEVLAKALGGQLLYWTEQA